MLCRRRRSRLRVRKRSQAGVIELESFELRLKRTSYSVVSVSARVNRRSSIQSLLVMR